MKQIIEFEKNGVEYLGVCAPEGATDFACPSIYLSPTLQWWIPDNNGVVNTVGSVVFPFECKILFTFSEATEEQCADLVDRKLGNFKNYDRKSRSPKDLNWDFFTKNSKDSLRSRIHSLGGDDTKNWVILKKI